MQDSPQDCPVLSKGQDCNVTWSPAVEYGIFPKELVIMVGLAAS